MKHFVPWNKRTLHVFCSSLWTNFVKFKDVFGVVVNVEGTVHTNWWNIRKRSDKLLKFLLTWFITSDLHAARLLSSVWLASPESAWWCRLLRLCLIHHLIHLNRLRSYILLSFVCFNCVLFIFLTWSCCFPATWTRVLRGFNKHGNVCHLTKHLRF